MRLQRYIFFEKQVNCMQKFLFEKEKYSTLRCCIVFKCFQNIFSEAKVFLGIVVTNILYNLANKGGVVW